MCLKLTDSATVVILFHFSVFQENELVFLYALFEKLSQVLITPCKSRL